MFLQRLKEYAEQQDDLPPAYYRERPPEFLIDLDDQGRLLTATPTDLRSKGAGASGNTSAEKYMPYIVRRGTHYKPFLLCDQADYTFGWSPSGEHPERTAKRHSLYIALLHRCAEETDASSVWAVLRFLERAPLDEIEWPEDHNEADRFAFRVNGSTWPTKQSSVQAFWADTQVTDDAPRMQCIVCGQRKPVLRRLKNMIRGVPGASSGYAQIISANDSAYESYGLAQSLIAPICAGCAESMTTGLGKLLSNEETHLRMGNGVFAFWTREETSFNVSRILSDPKPPDVQVLLQSVYSGRPYKLETDQFYAVNLTAVKSRVQVRQWISTTMPQVEHSLAQWFRRQAIVGPNGEPWPSLGLRHLAAATVRFKERSGHRRTFERLRRSFDVEPEIQRQLLLAALLNRRLPHQILCRLLQRIHAENNVDYFQAALLKLTLSYQLQSSIYETDKEDPMTELDLSNRQPAYLCGRLLAEIDAAQYQALGQRNATVIDRFYGTASTAPASVFGNLLRGTQAHLSKLRQDKPGAFAGIQQRLEEIMSGLEGFPRTLSLDDQALFALGYYHQRAYNRHAITEALAARDQTSDKNE